MRPGDRTIRDELRREAAKVSIPDDMWQNISKQLDQDSVRKSRSRRIMALGEQWRPAVILAVAAGFFWFALIPSLPTTETIPGNSGQSAIVIPGGKSESNSTPTTTPGRENEPVAAAKPTLPADKGTIGLYQNLPQ